MMRRNLSMPELGLIAGTRALLGAGIGLLVADQLTPEHRRAVGWTLVGVGLLSTLPLAADVIMQHKVGGGGRGMEDAGNEEVMTSGRTTF
jgi:hypothetical protein